MMKKLIILLMLLVCAFSVTANPQQRDTHHKNMRHVTPMPSLMMVVKHHANDLQLDDSQNTRLQQWSSKSSIKVQRLAAAIMHDEKHILQATLASEPAVKIQAIADKVMQQRLEIINTKLRCRDNMKKILNPSQWQQVVAIYSKEFLVD